MNDPNPDPDPDPDSDADAGVDVDVDLGLGRRDAECTTTSSFDDHGIPDGAGLISGTYRRLREAGVTEFEPSAELFDAVATAFARTYLDAVDEPAVPDHVDAAIEDARERTREAFAGRTEADLRTEVLPAFYQRVAGFHCTYR